MEGRIELKAKGCPRVTYTEDIQNDTRCNTCEELKKLVNTESCRKPIETLIARERRYASILLLCVIRIQQYFLVHLNKSIFWLKIFWEHICNNPVIPPTDW